EVHVYAYDFDTNLPDAIKKINEKVVTERTPEEKAALEQYHLAGIKLVARTPVTQGGVYAVAFHPDGEVLAAAGSDGSVRLIDVEKGTVRKEFVPVTVQPKAPPVAAGATAGPRLDEAAGSETFPGGSVTALEVQPPALHLTSPHSYAQLV